MAITATATYNAALYCRLSRDDNHGSAESMSIQSQRDMLSAYADDKGFSVFDTYVDDGYTGTNFQRPDFLRMIEDIRRGAVNMVITKDLSRLGRNYIEAGQYRDMFFPSHNVRYIAINDGYDGLNTNNDIAPFKDILNEMYAKDISVKVRSARATAAKQGKFMGSKPPYGYRRSDSNRHVLVPDENVCGIVKRVFAAFAGGDSARHIAGVLNREGVETPNDYYFHLTGRPNPFPNKGRGWGSATITGILRRHVYIGHTVQNRVSTISHKVKQRVKIDPRDWVVVENTHLPLVDMETWARVQARFDEVKRDNSKRAMIRVSSQKEVSMFSGLVRCADCGGLMAYNVKPSQGRVYYVYRCTTYANNGRGACSVHNIHQSTLEAVVLDDIKRYAKLAEADENALVERLMKANAATRQVSVKECKKRLADAKKRVADIDGLVKKLFEEKAAGLVPDNFFKKLLADYDTEQRGLNDGLAAMQQELADCEVKANDITAWVAKIKKCMEIDALERPLLVELIDTITVSEAVKTAEGKRQEVTIKYRFVGCLDSDNVICS